MGDNDSGPESIPRSRKSGVVGADRGERVKTQQAKVVPT